MGQTYKNLRQQLLANGVLVGAGGNYEFSDDYLFGSSSSAAAVVAGSNRSGSQHWKNARGESLKEIEARSLAGVVSEESTP